MRQIFWEIESQSYSLEQYSLTWDHVCNIIVLSPNLTTSSIDTLMVSEYDTQVRPQTPYRSMNADNPWRKIDGFGVLDFGDGKESGWDQMQGNCGLKCVLYTIEAQFDSSGKEISGRRIIGRNFHTGELVYNVSNQYYLQTMTLTGWQMSQSTQISYFIGLGRCYE